MELEMKRLIPGTLIFKSPYIPSVKFVAGNARGLTCTAQQHGSCRDFGRSFHARTIWPVLMPNSLVLQGFRLPGDRGGYEFEVDVAHIILHFNPQRWTAPSDVGECYSRCDLLKCSSTSCAAASFPYCSLPCTIAVALPTFRPWLPRPIRAP
jgi:hypothetical protein